MDSNLFAKFDLHILPGFWENDLYDAKTAKYVCMLDRKPYKCSIVCRLFQGRSPFRCEVMSTSASAIPLHLTWKIASEGELPVSNFNLRILVTSPCYNIARARASGRIHCTPLGKRSKGEFPFTWPRKRFDYSRVTFTCNSALRRHE